jgi:hypothetical protein
VVLVKLMVRPRVLVVQRVRIGQWRQWFPNRAVRVEVSVTVTPAGQVIVLPSR